MSIAENSIRFQMKLKQSREYYDLLVENQIHNHIHAM
jgi:hypothetical protein